jgi:hypothetical protein
MAGRDGPLGIFEGYGEYDEIDGMPTANFAPGSFGCHEALQMASVFAELVEHRLCGHQAIKLNPEWAALADKAAQSLADLYQSIGAAHLKDSP